MFCDYYSVLDIPQSATKSDIRQAYKRAATRWHPDKNPGIDTTRQMQQINEAYLILSDEEARIRYDQEYVKWREVFDGAQADRSGTQDDFDPFDFKDFAPDDELLRKWMLNARRQAITLASNVIDDVNGSTKAALSGCWSHLKYGLVISAVLVALVFVVLAD